MSEKTAFVIACTGLDEPGLLAALCDSISEVNGSLSDSRMHRLGGIFSAIFVAMIPKEISRDKLESALNAARSGHTRIVVQPLHPTENISSHAPNTTNWLVSSAGADQPGILKALTHAIDDANCEFADVSTHVRQEDGEDSYILVCEIDAPADFTTKHVEDIVDPVGESLGVDFVVIPAEPDELIG